MPTKRLLFTLSELKEFISKKYKIPVENIRIFENYTMAYVDNGEIEITDDTYVFQADLNE